jgi:hypothetical protein
VCRAHDVRYFAYPTFWAALRSHVRWLSVMGQRPKAGETIAAATS